MTKTEKTVAGTWYTITCTAAATVTQEIDGEIAELATLKKSGTTSFRASASTVTIQTEGRYHILPTKAPAAPSISGGGSGTSGEQILPLQSAGLTVQHATWYENAAQGSIAVQPGVWRNEVMTCYLKTAVPVELSGVTWLYGQPFMGEGYTYVVALQQVDADTVLANLAYSLPK